MSLNNVTINIYGQEYTLKTSAKPEYYEKVSDYGNQKIIVITGKGSRSKNINDPYKSKDLSILKHSVPNYIQSNIDLMKIIREIDFDQVKDNFSGSFDIILK